MAALSRPRSVQPTARKKFWFERLMAILVLANFGLVVFDLSYIPFRDLYLRYLPEFTRWYGESFRGLEAERSTEAYLQTIEKLEDLEEQVGKLGLSSPEAEELLSDLRSHSVEIIDENPFQVANKSGVLEQIKNRMRDRMNTESAKQAFETFWSSDYLQESGWSDSMDKFFDQDIKPLLAKNYYRPIGENGAPKNLFFFQIDRWFIGIFGVEFFFRTLYLSRRYKGTNWIDAILWRWYDILLLIPFSTFPIWRWLALSRIIPMMTRLNQSNLPIFEPLRKRINRMFVTNFAIELTEVVVIRIIDQMQNLIQEGTISNWLLQSNANRPYVDINDIDEVQTISQRLISVVLYQVLPKIKPELDTLLHHSITSALNQSPAYQGFQKLPGIGEIPNQIAQQVVAEVSKNAYGALTTALEDPVGAELTQKLAQNFIKTLGKEIQQDQTLEEIQSLTRDLLEEVKINYVKRLAAEDLEQLQQQPYQIYEVTQRSQ